MENKRKYEKLFKRLKEISEEKDEFIINIQVVKEMERRNIADKRNET